MRKPKMCELLKIKSKSKSKSKSSSLLTASDSGINNLREAFKILQVEVNKSALNLTVSSEESSASCGSSSAGAVELKICPVTEGSGDVPVDVHSRKDESDESDESEDEGEEREKWPCGDEARSPRLAKSEDSFNEEEETSLEYTLAMIKPEALIYRKEIERLMVEEGFNICQTRWLQLTPEQVSDFYFDNYEQESFAQLVSCTSSAPMLVYVISKSSCIEDWKRLIGPESIADARVYAPDSIRGKYGSPDNETRKLVHGSADKNSAEKEIKYFFPDRKIEAMPKEEVALQYLWNEINEALTAALIKCCEEKPEDPIAWLGNWLLEYKITGPKYLCTHE